MEKQQEGQKIDALREQVMLVRPETCEQLSHAVEQTQAGNMVILSLERTRQAERERVLDFCTGLCAALSLSLKQASEQVYLLVPGRLQILELADDGLERLESLWME